MANLPTIENIEQSEAYLPIPENPAWPKIYELAVNDPVAGGPDGKDNRPHKELAERTEYLKQQTDQARADLDDHETRLATVEGSSAVAVSKALELAWDESDEGFAFELFRDAVHSWIDTQPVAVTRTVTGDDSIDVESTASLTVGASYVLYDEETSETIVVSEVLTGTRFKATQALAHTRENGTLARTNWDMHSGYAIAPKGGVFYGKPLSVLRFWNDGVLVIRRDTEDGLLSIAARKFGETVWQNAEFLESKQVKPGTRDERYRIPVGGVIEPRIQTTHGPSKKNVRIEHMILLTSPKAGRADAVRKPVNLAPADAASGIMETPTLTVNAYRSLYGLEQKGAELRVATDEGMSNVIYTATENGAVTSHQVSAGNLQTEKVYWWQWRNLDWEDVWSEWSDPTAFSTGSEFRYIAQPENVAPAGDATNVPSLPTLQCSAFRAVGGEDTQALARYRIALDLGFTNIVYDSGDCTDLISHTVATPLALDVPHYWQCRQTGQVFGTSGWSVPTVFTPHEVILQQGMYCNGTVDADGRGVVWDTPGTYDFLVPAGVTDICAVCVGGGGGGVSTGGGGGGLRYANSIPVTAGDYIRIVVGNAGVDRTAGTSSSVGTVMTANGGKSGSIASINTPGSGGKGVGGDGGGNGGPGGNNGVDFGGGGGAAGYEGNGGQGADEQHTAGNGSGGGGGGGSLSGGGGVELYGIGENGEGGSMGQPGKGGSDGNDGDIGVTDGGTSNGGEFGGGAGINGNGAKGGVRIMWGAGRSFPNNAALVS